MPHTHDEKTDLARVAGECVIERQDPRGVRIEVLTVDDIDQIREGIVEFIISGDPEVEVIWQPYLDKLATLRADQRILESARASLDASICECSHVDGEHAFVNPESNDVADCYGNDPPGFGNCGCKEFRPVVFVVSRAPKHPPSVDAVDPSVSDPGTPTPRDTESSSS